MELMLRIPIVQIGTSKGIRIPKKVLEACHMQDEVTALVKDDSITLAPARLPRQGWEKDFKRAHRDHADKQEMPDTLDAHLWDALDD
jgi:antitoxin MazE